MNTRQKNIAITSNIIVPLFTGKMAHADTTIGLVIFGFPNRFRLKSQRAMSTAESTTDPLTEQDTLISELANLEKQSASRKVKPQEFEILSKQLKERITRAESEAYVLARKDEAVAQKLRLRNYSDPAVQQVISNFLRSGGKPLEPEFGADRFPRYPIEGEEGQKVSVERPLLQRMADVRIVTEGLYERSLFCPRCASPSNVYLRFKCTQCGSIDISINKMIEHLQCGTIHQESAFRVGKNLICPSCKKLLAEPAEYRLIGVVCSCNSCKAHFEDPAESFFCRKCGNEFNLASGIVVDVFSYSMSRTSLEEARRFLGVHTLTSILKEAGFNVKAPGVMGGQTKEVVFSLLAYKDSKVIAMDLLHSDSEVDVQPVLELYIKTLETNLTLAVFGAIPRLSKTAKDVASMHNIQTAEGSTPNEVGMKILEIVRRI